MKGQTEIRKDREKEQQTNRHNYEETDRQATDQQASIHKDRYTGNRPTNIDT